MRNLQEELRKKVEPNVREIIKGIENPKECALPSLPYVGSDYEAATHRKKIYICGKGGGSWGLKGLGHPKYDENSTLDDLLSDPGLEGDWYGEVLGVQDFFMRSVGNFLGNRPDPKYTRGSWWREIYKVTGELLCDMPVVEKGWSYKTHGDSVVADTILSSIACSNLDKVAPMKGGNPKRALRKLLDGFYTIGNEIRILRPRVVWFPTGNEYDRPLKKALPRVQFTDIGDGMARVEGLEDLLASGGVAVKTPHPQAKTFSAKLLVEYLKKWFHSR